MQRKKVNKQKREQLKAEKANEYNEAFKHGYNIGYEQGKQDKEKELKNG